MKKNLFYFILLSYFLTFFISCHESEVLNCKESSYFNDNFKKVKVIKAEANQPSQNQNTVIEKSYDGDINTLYHTLWQNNPKKQINPNYYYPNKPLEVIYYFDGKSDIDQIKYYPRLNIHGNIYLFDLYAKYYEYGDFIKIKDNNTFNFVFSYKIPQGFKEPAILNFKRIKKPLALKLVVKKTVGERDINPSMKMNGGDIAVIPEIEFLNNSNKALNDIEDIFKDLSCSELKPDVTIDKIRNINNDLIRDIATQMYNNKYDSEYRIATYKPFPDPHEDSNFDKDFTKSYRENPTGIILEKGDFIVFAEGINIPVVIKVFDYVNDKYSESESENFVLKNGINKFNLKSTGLAYIIYYDKDGKNDIKIHFPNAKVNGYFNVKKNRQEDIQKIIDNAKYDYIDILGNYAHLAYPVKEIKSHKSEILSILKKFDDIVYNSQDFIGLIKYNHPSRNRSFFVVNHGRGVMNASNYRVTYSSYDGLFDINKLSEESWGLGHEIGHTYQLRPGIDWNGMGEVTNNLNALNTQVSVFKFPPEKVRLVKDNIYTKAISQANSMTPFYFLDAKGGKYDKKNVYNGVFSKIVPLWQLKLYICDVLGYKDFYKDLYEDYRTNNSEDYNPNIDHETKRLGGIYQLLFVKNVCKRANLDLTDFFEKWGFFIPVDDKEGLMTSQPFRVTQEQIDKVKKEIKDLNLPKPKHNNIHQITDLNINYYKK